MAKDRFGYGTEENVSDLEFIWTEFTDKEYHSPEMFHRFSKANLKDKIGLLFQYANDTDDRLWRSNEWRNIVKSSGENEQKAFEEFWKENE